ncbi:MAG: T9SS type A sorting domain-containing protein [Candidatus Zixiibacteriota bacterium]
MTPPCFRTNSIKVTWDTPANQQAEPDSYKVRLLFYTTPPSVFYTDRVCGHEKEICTWEGWEQRISVVAYKYGLKSNETEEMQIVKTGYKTCHPYSFGGMVEAPVGGDQDQLANKNAPGSFSLSQNHPNPFNPETDIAYFVPSNCHVNLTIFNIMGQKVITLVDEEQPSGEKSVHWDGKGQNGQEVASGIYFYRLRAGEYNEVRKMIMMK